MDTIASNIVGTGLFALDVVVRADGQVAAPKLGGSAGNVLYILGSMGWNVTPVGTLGDDPAAQIVRKDFTKVGANLRFVNHAVDRVTPVIFQHQLQSNDHGTHRFSFVCPSCGVRRRPYWNDDDALAVDLSALPFAEVFFLDRPTQLGVILAEHYAKTGSVVVFEPSDFGENPDLFARAIRSSHIVKYAADRISGLAGFDLQSVSLEIKTLGVDGLRFRTPSLDNQWVDLGAYHLPFVCDTAGAGDWCTAGMIFELHRQGVLSQQINDYKALTKALAFGQALSTLNCLTEGARGLLATWSSSRAIKSARELSALRLAAIYAKEVRPSMQFTEPRLQAFAIDVSDHGASEIHSNVNGIHCCTTL